MKDFMAKHARELDKTGIVKIDLDSFFDTRDRECRHGTQSVCA
jgi:hypothetical protein